MGHDGARKPLQVTDIGQAADVRRLGPPEVPGIMVPGPVGANGVRNCQLGETTLVVGHHLVEHQLAPIPGVLVMLGMRDSLRMQVVHRAGPCLTRVLEQAECRELILTDVTGTKSDSEPSEGLYQPFYNMLLGFRAQYTQVDRDAAVVEAGFE